MECPNCEKKIESEVVADVQVIEEKERVCLFLTCEHCKTELYQSVLTSRFKTI